MKTVKGVVVLCLLAFAIFIVFSVATMMAVVPFGANFTHIKTEQAPEDAAAAHEALAGNVTEMNVVGYTRTQTWQGYFGNISGTIQLTDVADNVMYNWSLASPQGEIYASNHSSILWTNVQCFNYTANGSLDLGDVSQRGSTSLYGLNLSGLEAAYGMNWDDVDGVNETFNQWGAGTHDLFYTNNLLFSEGECRNARIYSSAQLGEDNKFEEVLLYDPNNAAVIFTSIIDEDVNGFDNRTHDFEMLVLDNGHGTDIVTTRYYFYVELE
jgi:hypothetical protein